MAVDLDLKCYFTPNFTPGFDGAVGWKRPWQLAYMNLGGANDTVPGVHQYVHDQRWEDGLRAPIESIQITKTLDQGSWATVVLKTHSDRDIFEVTDNEVTTGSPPVHIGHMLPRMKFPYRAWDIYLKAKDDSSWHTPTIFRGMLTEASVQTLSDKAISNQQDGVWRITLDIQSFNAFNLLKDKGAPLWYHRANATTNDYHWAFTPQDSITFDQMITQVVAWMNQGRPTIDFPVTYSYSVNGASPYTYSIFDPIGAAITNTSNNADALTFTNGSTAVEGTASSQFDDILQPGMLIAPNANIAGSDPGIPGTYRLNPSNWGKIASITDSNTLVLTSNYAGTTRNAAASSRNANTVPIITCKDTGTWDILRQILQHMGVIQGLGYTYLPQLANDGAITVVRGGYDKAHAVDEDFCDTLGVQYYNNAGNHNPTTTLANGVLATIRFNIVKVPFSVVNDNEYWIQFKLWKWSGSVWSTVFTSPSVGYEYVEGPDPAIWKHPVPAHGFRYYRVPTQPTGSYYTWTAELVTAGSFTIAATGGLVYSPAKYNYINSPTKVSYGELKTFVTTMGKCSQVGIYHAATAIAGCVDGSTNAKCPDRHGCYPDPLATPAEAVNARYGILGSSGDYAYTSNENAWDTMCRQHSQTIYECFQNSDASVREPLEVTIRFNDGWTTDLVGSYLEVFSPELNEMVMVRCIEQEHTLVGNRLSTIMKGFRV